MQGKYYIVTYGCQMNVHESEKIAGLLRSSGCDAARSEEEADIIVFNTCCIRENAENHAFGNIGALKKLKRQKKDLIIAVGGCMTQEKGKTDVLKEKFPFIDVIFGTLNLEELPALIEEKRRAKKRIIKIREKEGEIVEGVQPFRTSFPNAWVNIAYGCNNFCSYCIVPYVRGRERSRKADNIIAEVQSLVDQGYKEITLLGQNVNSYGNDLNDGSPQRFHRRRGARHAKTRRQNMQTCAFARAIRLERDFKAHESPLHRRKVSRRNQNAENSDPRGGSHYRYYRRLPGRNGRGLS